MRGFADWSRGPAGPVVHRDAAGNVLARPPVWLDRSGPVVIVIGSDSPSNRTGKRVVHQFRSLMAAHAAGFTWAV
jgi:hypothetical protein